jgi:transposase
MRRRKHSREFTIEAVRLVRDRGVSVAQAARDLDIHANVLRKWVRAFSADPAQAFPGLGQMKPERLDIERLRREVARLKAERSSSPTLSLWRSGCSLHRARLCSLLSQSSACRTIS